MGRESRQTRRQRQRRQQARQQQPSTSRWAVLAGSGVIAAVIIVLVVLAVRSNQNTGTNGGTQANVGNGPTIRGIECNSSEQATYHIHAHLDIIVNGKTHQPPPYVGEDIQHDCLYWVHVHQPSYGVLHVEAPRKVEPTLSDFFAIWHQPFNQTQVWKYKTKSGQSMRVYVDEKLYQGDPQKIKLIQFRDIAIEIGPPWVKPKAFNYKKYGLCQGVQPQGSRASRLCG